MNQSITAPIASLDIHQVPKCAPCYQLSLETMSSRRGSLRRGYLHGESFSATKSLPGEVIFTARVSHKNRRISRDIDQTILQPVYTLNLAGSLPSLDSKTARFMLLLLIALHGEQFPVCLVWVALGKLKYSKSLATWGKYPIYHSIRDR